MAEINKSKPVMVTGATGYVAGWLIKKLLEEGLTVHAAVRDTNNQNKIGHLEQLAQASPGSIKYFKSDLLVNGSYEAMQGCELIYHTASPFITKFENAQEELIDPAVNGTANVLESANQTPTVKRIVVTSSCAAIYTDAIDCQNAPEGVLTEAIWNTTASLDYQPYSYSKTLAEKKAWEMSKQQTQWDLVTINPCFVMGPPLNPSAVTSATFDVMKQVGDGTMKMGAPKIGVGIVDVRDVATAHYNAGFIPEASGRYVTAAHNSNFLEMGLVLQNKFGKDYPIPKRALPKWLLMIVGPMTDPLFTRKFVRNNVNIPWKADNSKIKKDLGLTFRPLKETMEETFQAMIDAKVFA